MSQRRQTNLFTPKTVPTLPMRAQQPGKRKKANTKYILKPSKATPATKVVRLTRVVKPKRIKKP